ncbi:hypothetical protein E6R60_00630 [Streptomyces sp. A0642]|uniref:hypothetical protein n=1 Tax=Streptomyces sp. A0642 TaxID=2563100 RepID=UPI0010A2984D|nr:hypothetical protein [Streptomyces sp. A0642]THA79076.1 hypothetical protein E6R60_00630 [Streptomyces sp. A0642]
MAERCVLIFSRRGDREATEVASLLRRIGVPVHRLDADGLAGVEATCEPDGMLTLDGHRFAPTVTWLRHFSLRAAPGGPQAGPVGGRMVYRDAWTVLAHQLALASPASIGAFDPGQLVQRGHARALGVRTPRGVVTTDPAEAARLLPAGRYVLKVVDRHFVEPAPGRLAWYLPQVLDRSRLTGIPGLPRGTPVVLQEYVEHDAEFRVYFAGGELHAFDVAKAHPRDIWAHPDRVRVRYVRPPAAVAAAVRALAGAAGLTYGAFDFLSDRGEAVFLEMNAHGDWHWFEHKAGVDLVTRAVVRTVRDLHRSAVGDARPAAVGLLTFLGAGAGAGALAPERRPS